MTEKPAPNPKPYGSPVVGYVRSPRLNDPALDEAEAQIRAYCAEQGWNLAKVFREEGISSVAAWRPQFEEMVRGLERRNWVGVVIKQIDHLSGQAYRMRRIIERIQAQNAWIAYVDNTEKPTD